MKIHSNGGQAPIVILAAQIVEDVSELCMRMAIINRGKPPERPARK